MSQTVTMEKIVALAKNRGFIFQGSEIYGGLANAWDYGPLGVLLKNNVKQMWWQKFVQEQPLNVGVDCAILMNPQVWVASGHATGFTDPLIDCKSCKARFRADQLLEEAAEKHGEDPQLVSTWDNDRLQQTLADWQLACPQCGARQFTPIRQFNLMFKTFQGATEDRQAELFLRPETAQGIFVNFKNIQRSTRKKIPFGVCQIGKAFRNEITPGNFVFRTREFEQMELEFFCKPGTDLDWFNYWRTFCYDWLVALGLKSNELRLRDHTEQELAFYALATTDIEFLFPFGWGELWGIADRTDYDLKQHMDHAREDMTYFDPQTQEKYIPYVVEPSLGADRVALAFLCSAYDEEALENGDTRVVLRLHPALAPYKVAVLPLSAKLSEEALAVFDRLTPHWMCDFDDRQSIGKRYRRQDEIGTPYCVTFDFDSLEDRCVTVRSRDSMEQVRLPIDTLVDHLNGQLKQEATIDLQGRQK